MSSCFVKTLIFNFLLQQQLSGLLQSHNLTFSSCEETSVDDDDDEVMLQLSI